MSSAVRPPEKEVVVMDLAGDDHGGRWSGTVEFATTETISWGTYEWTVRFQYFSCGEAHVEVRGPGDPLCKREIVTDLLAQTGIESVAASVMADAWEIDADAIADELNRQRAESGVGVAG